MSPEGSPTPSSKEGSPRHSVEERQSFEDLKQAMEEELKKQLDAVKRKIEETQRQLEEEKERYQQATEGLEEKKRELSDDQQKFLQQQIDEQNKRFDVEILWKTQKPLFSFSSINIQCCWNNPRKTMRYSNKSLVCTLFLVSRSPVF